VLIGLCLWIAMLHSGVHATLSGVLLAFCIPHRPRLAEDEFPERVSRVLERFHTASGKKAVPILNDERVTAIHELEDICESVEPMLQRLEVKLHPFVSFGILPLFALINAGVHLSPETLHTLFEPLGLGILLGLCLGKPLGITLFSWLAIRIGLGAMPAGASWMQMIGAGILAGIGFTMSIFIAGLGLNPSLLDGAKIAILCSSFAAGLAGYLFLRMQAKPAE
jgi:NhaA family Na+:H+ antiporter